MSREKILTLEEIPWDVLIRNCDEEVPDEIRVHLKPICNTLWSSVEKNEFSTDF